MKNLIHVMGNRRRAMAAGLIIGALHHPAAASAQDIIIDDPTAVWSVSVENDGFFGSDRNYTSGFRLAYLSGNQRLDRAGKTLAESILRLDTNPDYLRVRRGISIAQELYTPTDITAAEPLPDQHPYAGYLYVRVTSLIEQIDRVDQISVDLGVVGPSAQGQEVQDAVHNFVERERSQGWDNQIDDTPAINLSYDRQKRLGGSRIAGQLAYDTIINGGLSLGTVDTSVRAGANFRLGTKLSSGYGPPRVRPSSAGSGFFRKNQGLSGYVFVGSEVKAIAHNIFLDGSLFRDDDPSVDTKPVVIDLQTGMALQVTGTQISFSYIIRSKEFETQEDRQRFGAISVSRRF